jgi:hypothetical protein
MQELNLEYIMMKIFHIKLVVTSEIFQYLYL